MHLKKQPPLPGRRLMRRLPGWFIIMVLSAGLRPAHADALDDARQLLLTGKYTECARQAAAAARQEESNEEWRLLLLQAQMATGQYADAFGTLTNALARYPHTSSIRLRWLGREVLFFNRQPERAKELLLEINQLAGSRTWAYRDPQNLIALGHTALRLGADPRLVLEKLYDPAKKAAPGSREVYLAPGELALDKGDFALASQVFLEGLKKFPDDADLLCGLAQSFTGGDRTRMLHALEKALDQNTNHVPSLLLLADHLVDAEEYGEAEKTLARALAVNPARPEAWAYRAVLAHLQNNPAAETKARATALDHWTNNPVVDHLIGKKLSQKYRFAEGAAAQKRALKFDRAFLPAKAQLAQDLLRLGDEDEGWALADEVHADDAYDVTTYNLVTLKDTMAKFTALTNGHFVVRMSAREAGIYGPRVLELLGRARTNLCQKYELQLDRPVIVEIFPEQKDFGVRTFGMPGNPGFLGVCFGRVITANSPASQGANPANWEAVLWHEFCHVVTLSLTKNKMPRWLSEGISVYEERQANPTWGQVMNPHYRELVLGKDLTPVGDLSAAFLAPRSDLHLQFAYYESSLVVEFLIRQFGVEKLRAILRDLGEGGEINAVIARQTVPLAQLEKDFSAFARERAGQLAPGLEWDKPRPAETRSPDYLTLWAERNPKNFYALTQQAKKLISEKKWAEAKAPLQKLIELYPGHTGADNAHTLLAEAQRALNETAFERATLTKLAALDAAAVDAYDRLMELGAEAKDWADVALNARRFLAVNPLVPKPHRQLARASEELGDSPAAIQSWLTLLQLDPPDPAEVHFHLAKLLHQTGGADAKRHVLQALEEAPRYREAHRLLLEMEHQPRGATNPSAGADKP